MGAPLTKDEVVKVGMEWLRCLDEHAPEVEILPLLADKELKMVFPEATLYGQRQFEGWYQGVIRIFFDEVHTMGTFDVEISPDGQEATAKIVMLWEASRWKPPARYSERLKMDAYQTWKFARSAETGKCVITSYIVDRLEPRPGSAQL